MAGLFADHGEDEQSQLTVIEWPSAVSMLAMTMMVLVMVDFASAAPRIFRGSSAAATAVSTMLVHWRTIYRDIAEIKLYLN